MRGDILALALGVVAATLGLVGTAQGLMVELNLLYVHGVKNCTASRQNADASLDELAGAVNTVLPARIAAYEAAHPGIDIVVNTAYANIYTATPSGVHPSDSPDPLNLDDWEVGDPGCSATQQGDPCTAAYEWRYRLAEEIDRLYPAPAANVILVGHSTGARTAMEVAANVGPSGAVNTYDWGVRQRIAGVVTLHGMLDAIGTSKYNVVGITSFESACKNGDAIVGFGDSCAPGNGWCEYAGRVDGFPAADWVAQNKRALMLTGWGSCSPSAWTGRSDGSLPYDAQGSALAVGLDMTPAPGETWRVAHGERYGAFCHSAIDSPGNAQHAAARDAARQRIVDWLFVAAPRVAASGTNTTPSIAFNQFSATFTMGSSCAAGEIDDTLTSGTEGLGLDVVGVCRHPGFFDGDDHAIAASEISTTNGSTCNGTYRWQQAHDSSNNHAASFWWKTRSLRGDGPDIVNRAVTTALAACGDGDIDVGEACDDGNTAGGDCCSPTCVAAAANTPCASDGNLCTTDVCNAAGVCGHAANTAPCEDGAFCNGADTCAGGTCSAHAGDPCGGGAECNATCNEVTDSCAAPLGTACGDDGNLCTDDRCNGGGACVHPANSAPCSDGIFCNGADTCSAGSCAAHTGNPCLTGAVCNDLCNEAADSCTVPAGVACSSDGNPCTDDRCNGAGGCIHPPNNAPCSDGVFCNGSDTCSGGSCAAHAGDPCSAGAPCNNVCNEAGDSCAVAAGVACGDDGNTCTDDRCNGSGACAHPANSAPCNDSLFCNGADTCSGGSCATHAGDPCSGGAACNNVCNESADNCAATAGSPCPDDANPCSDDRCDGAGACTHPFNSAPCEDGNVCTSGDVCGGGVCIAGPGPVCGRCETCDGQVGCVVAPRPDCRGGEPGSAQLKIRDQSTAARDSIGWKWRRGAATSIGDFGAGADYSLCLFDESAATPVLLFAATVPGDDQCGAQSCWRAGLRLLKYKDRSRTPEGIDSLRLLAGATGRASILLKGKGALLSSRADGLPPAPLGLPLRIQLQRDGGACWEATYSSAAQNEAGTFKATSD